MVHIYLLSHLIHYNTSKFSMLTDRKWNLRNISSYLVKPIWLYPWHQSTHAEVRSEQKQVKWHIFAVLGSISEYDEDQFHENDGSQQVNDHISIWLIIPSLVPGNYGYRHVNNV